jgi:hypothetical protein
MGGIYFSGGGGGQVHSLSIFNGQFFSPELQGRGAGAANFKAEAEKYPLLYSFTKNIFFNIFKEY